jgi:hypothetical protein
MGKHPPIPKTFAIHTSYNNHPQSEITDKAMNDATVGDLKPRYA